MFAFFGNCRAQCAGVLRGLARDPIARDVLLWSLPSLLIGLVLRTLLTISLPYGYVQYDTADFLVTTQRFVSNWDLVIHNKKTFLTPILFTLAYLFKIVPALIIIPLVHHLLGLVMTLISGVLARLWFRQWKWFIIPVTVLTTANPAILWYEHALMAEFHYVFCVMLLASIATGFALFRTRALYISLLMALVFTAGSRPEGKLYFSAAFLLVGLAYWGDWKEWGRKLAILAVVTVGTFAITKTGQAGTLLYATVLPLAPDSPKSAPDFGPRINPLRDEYRAEGLTVRKELTAAEKDISEIVQGYLSEKGIKGDVTAAFCQKMAIEACLNQPLVLPMIAANKFLMSMRHSSSAEFNEYWVYTKQHYAFTRKPWMFSLTRGLTGQDLRTEEDVENWLQAHCRIPHWFAGLQDAWDQLTIKYALPAHNYPIISRPAKEPSTKGKEADQKPSKIKAAKAKLVKDKPNGWTPTSETGGEDASMGESKASNDTDKTFSITGLPYFFLLAIAGMLAAILRPGSLRIFHLSWVACLAGVWFVVMLTGVVNSRYRFIFEPFCTIYALLLLDILWCAVASLFANPVPIKTPQPEATEIATGSPS